MQQTTISMLVTIIAASLLLAGCGGNSLKPDARSGYLKDYSDLAETKGPKGDTFFRFANPKFTPNIYRAVMVEPPEFYPKPEPTEQLSQETLNQIQDYLDQSLLGAIRAKVQIVEKAGPGVARLNVAITAVVAQNQSLKSDQYIPVAFIVVMTKRAFWGRAQEAKLAVEALATDSVTGETLLKAVRFDKGETLDKVEGKRELTLASVKPLIDQWAAGVTAQITEFVLRK